VLVLARALFDEGLALGVVAGGGEGFEAALGDVLAAARADAVAALVEAQQRLVDVGHHLRLALAEAVLDLLINVLHGHVGHVLDAVVVACVLQRVVLVVARVLRRPPELREQDFPKPIQFLLIHHVLSVHE
jgi:hypothetical protein